ncbi:MAG TPA: hypothetical protein VGL71_05480, partial [Urbifossiella sp.]
SCEGPDKVNGSQPSGILEEPLRDGDLLSTVKYNKVDKPDTARTKNFDFFRFQGDICSSY